MLGKLDSLLDAYNRGQGIVSPKETAAEYQKILEAQARDVSTSNDTRLDTLNNLLDPDAIEKGTTPDETKRMGALEFANSAMARQEMTPQERWKNTIDSMIKSGNPVLQQQGIASLDNYFSSASSSGSSYAPSTAAKMAREMGLKPGTKSFNDFIERYAFKPGTTINMSDDTVKPGDKFVDINGNQIKAYPGEKYGEIRARGGFFAGDGDDAEQIKQDAQLSGSIDTAAVMRDLIEKEGADISGFAGLVEKHRSEGNLLGAAIDLALNEGGITARPQDIQLMAYTAQLSNAVTQALRGAAVGSEEQEMVNRQLPVPGQPMAVFMANLAMTERNLIMLQNRIRAKQGKPANNIRPQSSTPRQSSAPRASVKPNINELEFR